MFRSICHFNVLSGLVLKKKAELPRRIIKVLGISSGCRLLLRQARPRGAAVHSSADEISRKTSGVQVP